MYEKCINQKKNSTGNEIETSTFYIKYKKNCNTCVCSENFSKTFYF